MERFCGHDLDSLGSHDVIGHVTIGLTIYSIYGVCQHITACVEDVVKWMGANHLQLNVAKTEFLWCSSRQRMHQLPASPVTIGGNSVHPASVVRDLVGV